MSHVWSVCFSLYEALLKLDQRCCTMHSFIFYVMNILLSSSYQLQFISLDGCTVHVFYLVSDLTVTILIPAEKSLI